MNRERRNIFNISIWCVKKRKYFPPTAVIMIIFLGVLPYRKKFFREKKEAHL